MIRDGKGIPITHVGSPTTTFSLNNVLCVPLIKKIK